MGGDVYSLGGAPTTARAALLGGCNATAGASLSAADSADSVAAMSVLCDYYYRNASSLSRVAGFPLTPLEVG